MTIQPLRNSINHAPLRLGFFLPALAVACFALLPSTGTAECDTKQVNGAPNFRLIQFSNLTINSPGQCTPENVRVSGDLHVNFKVNEKGKVRPEPTNLSNLVNFSGEGLTTQRPYVANDVDIMGLDLGPESGFGSKSGKFNLIVQVNATANSALGNYTFKIKWTVRYQWNDKKKVDFFALFDGIDQQCKPVAQCN
jgi:hypothetical protein